MGFPYGSGGKESTSNLGDTGLIPGWENGNPLQCRGFLLSREMAYVYVRNGRMSGSGQYAVMRTRLIFFPEMIKGWIKYVQPLFKILNFRQWRTVTPQRWKINGSGPTVTPILLPGMNFLSALQKEGIHRV